jgi:hypothetical protein
MELGNEMFGHSRGKFALVDRKAFSASLAPLFAALENSGPYGIEFKNDVFEMHPYCWCGKEDCQQCGHAAQPQFKHYESGLEIQWYKYAMRDAYSNQEITPEALQVIVMQCVASLPQEMLSKYIRNTDVDKMYPDKIDLDRTLEKMRRNSVSGAPRITQSTPLFNKTMHATLTAAARDAVRTQAALLDTKKDNE